MIFGTSGVRGFINSTLTPTFAYKITKAFVKVYHVNSLTIGRDNRAQSVPVAMAVVSALLSSGVNVVDLGIAPTPATIRIMKELKYDSAISVTGSHTPPPITGILFFLSDTGELGPADSESVEKAYRKGNLAELPWTKTGKYETFYDYPETYLQSIKRDAPKTGSGNIIFDAGNGTSGPLSQLVFSDLGLDFKVINKLPLHNFPNRLPSPIPAHLKELTSLVPRESAAFGVATDSDSVGEVVKSAGGKLTVTKVGPPAIAESIRKHGDAIFATEESGKFIWPRILMYGDAIYSTLMLLSFNEPLSELAKMVPFFYLIKREVRCQDEIKQKIMEKVSIAFSGYRINKLDGIKIRMGKHRWLLIRPSGTEPVFRVFAQSAQRKDAEALASEGVRIIQDSKSSI